MKKKKRYPITFHVDVGQCLMAVALIIDALSKLIG
jgi:hypothetical protein